MKRKLLSFLMAILFVMCFGLSFNKIEVNAAGGTDVLTADKLLASTVNASSYTKFDNKSISGGSDAVYNGQIAKTKKTDGAIQLRATSPSGIVTTTSGGKVSKITIDWVSDTDDGRTIDVYGKSTAYESAANLYSSDYQGKKIGSIVKGTSTELVIEGNYEYIGIRSNSGALYATSITIEWTSTTSLTANFYDSVNGTKVGTKYYNSGDKIQPVTDLNNYEDADYKYEFAGWKTLTGTSAFDFANSPLTVDMDFYPLWNRTAKTVQEKFVDLATNANLKFSFTDRIYSYNTITLDSNTWKENTDNNKEVELSTLKTKLFGDYSQYVTNIERIKNDSTSFPGLNNSKLYLYTKSSSSDNSAIKFEFNQTVKSIKLTYDSANNKGNATLIVGSTSSEIVENVETEVNSTSLTIKNNLMGDSKDTKSNRVVITSIEIKFESVVPASNFNNVELQFQYNFDLSSYENVSGAGIVVTNDKGEIAEGFTDANGNSNYLDAINSSKTKVYVNNYYKTKSTFTVGIKVPTSTDYSNCKTTLYVAAYVIVDGVYYFSQICNSGNGYSVESAVNTYIAKKTELEISDDLVDVLNDFSTLLSSVNQAQ